MGVTVSAADYVGASNRVVTPVPDQLSAGGGLSELVVAIDSGASLSAGFTTGVKRLGKIHMPAAWTAADLTFQTSGDGGLTWNDLFDKDGNEYVVKAAASRSMIIPLADMLSTARLKIRSGTSAVPVVQSAARSLALILVS